MFIHNTWYVAGWSSEVPSDGFLARTILGTPLALWRDAQGQVVAFEDMCCHRGAPLSRGRREGDCVRCMYHGLLFDRSGKCVEVPSQDLVPANARVRTFPIVERHRWIWIWMGDVEKADPALVPDTHWLDDPAWRSLEGYTHYDTNYLLICDNLLDFSHLSYVHEKTLGGSPRIAQAVPAIEKVPGPTADWPQLGIRVTRHVPDVPPPPFYQRFRPFETHIDRWFIYDFLLPGTLLMHSGGRPVGDPDDRRAVRLHSCQTLTPETESSTHYFFQQSHPADALDEAAAQAMTESIYASLVQAFNEDRDMITAQYRNILRNPAAPMLPLAMDAALTQFRRLLTERARREHPQAATAASA